jgi:cullin-associated NEDD8-dissociated protein 1
VNSPALLTHYLRSYRSGVPADLIPTLIPQIRTYISTSDIVLLSHSLTLVAILLELSPSTTFPAVERDLLPGIYVIAHSPLVSGAALDSTLAFFSALVQADQQIATHVVPNLTKSLQNAPKNEASFANVAKCIAQVVKSAQGVAAGTIAEFSKYIKVKFVNFYAVSLSTTSPLLAILKSQYRTDHSQSSSTR